MLEDLKKRVFKANLELPKRNLIKYTWGNVSEIDEERKHFAIKPSGVSYEEMTYEDMVICDLQGNIIEGDLNPSSDMLTHAVLYRNFEDIGGIVHTHSPWATTWAQAGEDVPAMGTTHADTFYGSIPCARYLTQDEVDRNYEESTGDVIVETFEQRNIKPMEIPAVLLKGHGPFTWGKDATQAVMNAVVLEEVCKTNYHARQLNSFSEELPQRILDKHYFRKHGKDAYYGQK